MPLGSQDGHWGSIQQQRLADMAYHSLNIAKLATVCF